MRSLITLLLLPLISAHFEIKSPVGREGDEMKMGDFPCGGGTTPSSKRTEWPLAGGPIQVKMEHDRVATAVYLGLGDNPKAFNTTLVPQEIQQGIGDFCYANVTFPTSLNLKKGDLATIQIITSAEDGKLFQCADIVFTDTTPSPPLKCLNGPNVQSLPDDGSMGSASSSSSSDSGSEPSSSAKPSTSATGTATGAATSPTSSPGVAATVGRTGAWGVVVAGAVGVAALL